MIGKMSFHIGKYMSEARRCRTSVVRSKAHVGVRGGGSIAIPGKFLHLLPSLKFRKNILST